MSLAVITDATPAAATAFLMARQSNPLTAWPVLSRTTGQAPRVRQRSAADHQGEQESRVPTSQFYLEQRANTKIVSLFRSALLSTVTSYALAPLDG